MKKRYDVFINDKLIEQVELKETSENDLEQIKTFCLEKGTFNPEKDSLSIVVQIEMGKLIDIRRYVTKTGKQGPSGAFVSANVAIRRSLLNIINTYGEDTLLQLLAYDFKLKREQAS